MRRRHYFIHKSMQTKYIFMVCLPLVIVGFFNLVVMRQMGSFSIRTNRERLLTEIGVIDSNLKALKDISRTPQRIEQVRREMESLKDLAQSSMIVNDWAWSKIYQIIIFDIIILVFGGTFLALIFSHRIAGPIYRIDRYIQMLARGEGIPPVKVRGYDEFKEVAASLENLRLFLNEKRNSREKNLKEIERKIEIVYRLFKEEQPKSELMQRLDDLRKSVEDARKDI